MYTRDLANDKMSQFLRNGGNVEQATGMFEVTPKLERFQNSTALSGLQEGFL